jgi:maleylpyruvate isomerase
MKLYGYWRSSASWRVRIALEYKRIAYTYQPVHLVRDGGEQHSEAYRQCNPMEQVPTLELYSEGEVRRLSQSLAIIEYLEQVAPTPPLYPHDPYHRARARQLAELVNSGIQPLQNTGVVQELKRLGVDELAWCVKFVDKGLRALEASAAETAGRFLVGDHLTVADVCMVPQLYHARRFGVDLAQLPLLSRVEEACMQLDAFQRAHAERQPDAPKP